MRHFLRPAADEERAFCEWLNRRNMGGYLATRRIVWRPDRFVSGSIDFETLDHPDGVDAVHLLRLASKGSECFGPQRPSGSSRAPRSGHRHLGSTAGAGFCGYSRLPPVASRVYEEARGRCMLAWGSRQSSIAGGTLGCWRGRCRLTVRSSRNRFAVGLKSRC